MIRDRDQGRWHILTGEYPPQMGGVADYTRLVAHGLAACGTDVHIWTSQLAPESVDERVPGVTVHREAGGWSRTDLVRIGRGLDAFARPRRILLQFAPNAFGHRGINPHLGPWLVARRRAGDSVRVMFHEVTYYVKPGDTAARRALAFLQRRLLVAPLLRAADAVDINIRLWERMLRPLDPVRGRDYVWCPVPSAVPIIDDPDGVASIRRRLTAAAPATLIGSFGTFARDVTALLEGAMLPLLLGHPGRAGVMIGRGGERVAAAWLRDHPELTGRLAATGSIPLDEVSRYLQACDLLIQPYPGGISTKRSSVMAGIAHGIATVTTQGATTEADWSARSAAAIVSEGDGPGMIALAEKLLVDPAARARLGEAGRALYEDRCALSHTIDALTGVRLIPTPAEPACP